MPVPVTSKPASGSAYGETSGLTPLYRPDKKTRPGYRTVEEGDTLYLMPKKYDIKLDGFMGADSNMNPCNMITGTKLLIPSN